MVFSRTIPGRMNRRNLGPIQAVVANDPTTLPGSAALVTVGRADRGITLGAAMLRTVGAAGALTLSGNLAQALGVFVIISLGGTLGNSRFELSLDGGITFVAANVPTAATHDTGRGIIIGFSAASYVMGATFRATVAQIVDYKFGFVFAQATASLQPILDWQAGNPALLFDGVDDILPCATAGVCAWIAGDDLPYTIVQTTRYSGAVNNGKGAIHATSSTTGANIGFGSSTPQTWLGYKQGDTGVVAFSGGGGGGTPVVPLTTYVSECSSTGLAVTVTQNGAATTIVGTAQDTVIASTIDTLNIGSGNTGSSKYWVSEWAIYSGNQRAVLAPVLAYMSARYVDYVSTRIADGFFFDSGANSGAGNAPITNKPNDYVFRDNYADVRGTIAPGVTSLSISAVEYMNGSLDLKTAIGVYLDNVITPYAVLSFNAGLGGRQTQALAVDGAAHTIRIDEYAALYSVTGVTLSAKSAPNTRVLLMGDSITFGYQSVSHPFDSWAEIVKASLDQSVYGTTNFGVQGVTLNGYASSGPVITTTVAKVQAFMDGSSKNILVLALGTNDYANLGGSTSAAFGIQLTNLVAALNTAMPALKILLFSPTNRNVETANGGGSTLPNYRTATQAVATANPTFCTYLDGNGIITVPGDLSSDPHPNTSGYAKIAAAVLPAVQAL